MWWLAPGNGTLVAMRGRTRRRAAWPLRPSRAADRATGRPHSRAALCAPWWREACDTTIVLFTTQIKHRPCTPADDHALELKVTFCVRGVISPLMANIYMHRYI